MEQKMIFFRDWPGSLSPEMQNAEGRIFKGHKTTFLFKQRFKSLFMEILYMFAFQFLSSRRRW